MIFKQKYYLQNADSIFIICENDKCEKCNVTVLINQAECEVEEEFLQKKEIVINDSFFCIVKVHNFLYFFL